MLLGEGDDSKHQTSSKDGGHDGNENELHRHIKTSIWLEKLTEAPDDIKKPPLEIDRIFALSMERISFLVQKYDECSSDEIKDLLVNVSLVEQLTFRKILTKKLVPSSLSEHNMRLYGSSTLKDSIETTSNQYKVFLLLIMIE